MPPSIFNLLLHICHTEWFQISWQNIILDKGNLNTHKTLILIQSVTINVSYFILTHTHTPTATDYHARRQPSCQEQPGVRCRSWTHRHTQDRGLNRQPSNGNAPDLAGILARLPIIWYHSFKWEMLRQDLKRVIQTNWEVFEHGLTQFCKDKSATILSQ